MKHHDFLRDHLRLSVVEGTGTVPVVFQHGLCGSADQTFEAFPSDGHFRCITVECRGHGGSDTGDAAKFSIATFTDDVASYMQRTRIGPCAVGGISMGAAIALRMAVKYPDLVSALVLVRPAWVLDDAPASGAANREVGALLAEHGADEAKRIFLESRTAAMLRREAPDNLASLTGFFSRKPVAVTAALLRAIASDGPDVTAQDVMGIAVPSLIVGHDLDVIHPIGHARELQLLIKGSRFVQITPKATDKAAYVRELQTAIHNFLKDISQ